MPNTKTYRKFSYLSDLRGIRSAIGEMRGIGYPRQPKLNKFSFENTEICNSSRFIEEWFIQSITKKNQEHPENAMEGPVLYGQRIFDAPLIDFVRGDHPLFEQYKTIIGPHHLTPFEIMKWQAEQNHVDPPAPADISVVSFILPINQRGDRRC